MRHAQKVQPNGVVEFRTFACDDHDMVSVIIPDGVKGRAIDIEFRLSDFIAFADYTADIAEKIMRYRQRA